METAKLWWKKFCGHSSSKPIAIQTRTIRHQFALLIKITVLYLLSETPSKLCEFLQVYWHGDLRCVMSVWSLFLSGVWWRFYPRRISTFSAFSVHFWQWWPSMKVSFLACSSTGLALRLPEHTESQCIYLSNFDVIFLPKSDKFSHTVFTSRSVWNWTLRRDQEVFFFFCVKNATLALHSCLKCELDMCGRVNFRIDEDDASFPWYSLWSKPVQVCSRTIHVHELKYSVAEMCVHVCSIPVLNWVLFFLPVYILQGWPDS